MMQIDRPCPGRPAGKDQIVRISMVYLFPFRDALQAPPTFEMNDRTQSASLDSV